MQAYGPWLTSYGQKFKLDGYVAGNANALPNALNPFSLEVVSSYTNTQQSVPSGTYYQNKSGSSSPNNNVINDWTALFYTGRVTDHIGAYLQLNLNPQVAHTASLTSSVTLTPGAQPYLQRLMSGAYTAGSTAYVMINNHLYLEGGAYTSMAQNMAGGLGVMNASLGTAPQNGLINGAAPYWRAYLQHSIGSHTMMIGTFGLAANVTPYYTSGFGTDNYTEFNADSNYSYMMNDDNMFMAMFRYTRDNMKMGASSAMGASSNIYNNLDSSMLMGMWTYRQTYNLAVGWNRMSGSADATLYNGAGNNIGIGYQGPTALTGSASGSPNSNSFLFQADYVPFGKGTSKVDPYLNVRFSAQYWVYTQFNGATMNYDGLGRNASANNTLYLVTNIMF